jgi:hypothetical protein
LILFDSFLFILINRKKNIHSPNFYKRIIIQLTIKLDEIDNLSKIIGAFYYIANLDMFIPKIVGINDV